MWNTQNENENGKSVDSVDMTVNDAEHSIKPPPPIYIKWVLGFQGLCIKLIELIGVGNFIYKSTVDRLKNSNKKSWIL